MYIFVGAVFFHIISACVLSWLWHKQKRGSLDILLLWCTCFAINIVGITLYMFLIPGEATRVGLAIVGPIFFCAVILGIDKSFRFRRTMQFHLSNPFPVFQMTAESDHFLLMNESAKSLVGKSDRNSILVLRDEAIKARKIQSREMRIDSSIFSVTAVPIGDFSIVNFFWQDISQLIDVRQRLDEERLKSSSVESMATIGEMAAEICHDIRSPLSIMLGFCRILKEKHIANALETERLDSGLMKIESAGQRIEKIVSGVMTLSRSDSDITSFNTALESSVTEAFDLCSIKLTRLGVTTKAENSGNNLMVAIPETSLLRILVNLVNNACDAVSVLEKKWIVIKSVADEKMVTVSVVDSGEGIPEQIRAKLFSHLFTTKPKGQGTGLGLSLCRRIASEFGGSLEYIPDAKNTEFVLKIPRFKPI
jgi:signal transduction histidine kinase